MAKEKKSVVDSSRKEKTFFYEILGIISIIIAFIAITRLGLIGRYMMLTFRFLFGDWYFIFIILLGIYGLYCLIVHRKIEIKSIRYYGIILVLISLLTLTHFSMHNFVSNYEGNPFLISLNLYLEYFKTNRAEMMVGGGMIGSICFYMFYFLLSSTGTIIIAIILLFIGIVFLCKKTMKDFFTMVIEVGRKIGKFGKKEINKIQANIKHVSEEYANSNKNSRAGKKFFFIKNKSDESFQLKRCEELLGIIEDCFTHLEINLSQISYIICLHIIVVFIKSKQEINYRVLEHALNKVIKEAFMIKYDQYNQQTIIEINKIVPESLSFNVAYDWVLKTINNTNSLITPIFGMDDRNIIVEIDGNAIIISEPNELLYQYLISIFTFCMIQKNYQINSIEVIDLKNNLNEYCLTNVTLHNRKEKLLEIVNEIDHNLNKLNQFHKMDVNEYNLFNSVKIQKKYYFINGIEEIIGEQPLFDSLLYIVQTGKMAGITSIVTLSEDCNISNVLLSGMDYKIVLKNNFNVSKRLIGNLFFDRLSNDVEGFLKYKDLTLRMSLLLLKKEEFEKYYPFTK